MPVSDEAAPRSAGALADAAARTLAAAGVPDPQGDAAALVAHVFGTGADRPRPDATADEKRAEELAALVARRAARIPLGHLTGRAVLGGIEVAVAPGVFVPRVHSERVLAHALDALSPVARPVIVDLCTGSGAIALALAHARPDAQVHAVELDPYALDWARRNAARRAEAGDTPVHLHEGDVTDPDLLAALTGRVDLVTANPPFVPEGTELLPEYGEHHPRQAIFSGGDGLDVIRGVVRLAGRLLRPRGALVIEHGHFHEETVPALLRGSGEFTDVADHLDQDGRPLYATALRTG
ncbi:N5-glutamine methyltransferase family protein [Streptomyces sp. NPDC053542]|uniref:N5-glutamine methyltransferase family protein n=1 Tax=Streptomyces sp. NPDC053542 TaxID=3365710 RepID=UPI0037D1E24B